MRPRSPATAAYGLAVGGALFLCTLGTSPAQEVRYFDCAQVSFFTVPVCVAPALPAVPAPPPEAAPPSEEAPLFSPETMAADTPPLLLKVLEDPSVENARAFVAWQLRRQQRVQEVQRLLKALAAEPPR